MGESWKVTKSTLSPSVPEHEQIIRANPENDKHGQNVKEPEVPEADHHTVDEIGLHEAAHDTEHPKKRGPQRTCVEEDESEDEHGAPYRQLHVLKSLQLAVIEHQRFAVIQEPELFDVEVVVQQRLKPRLDKLHHTRTPGERDDGSGDSGGNEARAD